VRKVLIATPCYDGRTDVWFNHSLNDSIKLAAKHGIDLCPVYLSYDALIQRARNDLVRLAVESDCEALIFIDSDQAWEPEWILRLLAYPVDVVGGAVRKKSDAEAYNVRATLPIHREEATGLLVVDGLGTGFLKLSRKAFTALWDGSEEYRNEGRSCRMVFDVRVVNGELVSEDNIVSLKLKAAGIPVHLDPSMTCAHIGAKKWTGDFGKWLARLSSSA
jgi:hypothetical protein